MRAPALIVALCLALPAQMSWAAQAKPAPAKPEPAKPAPAQTPAAKPAPPAAQPAKPAEKPEPPKPAPGAKPPAPAPPAPPQAESYTYDPSGRRDPFMTLIGTGSQPRNTIQRGEGKAGLAVAELSVRGVMLTRGAFIATVQGPDGKTFIIHAGDKLADGVVKSINAEGLVVVQDVNDPLSLVKQREVSKKLRSLEVKQ
jgi:Tfp pilus assembly protein PilP